MLHNVNCNMSTIRVTLSIDLLKQTYLFSWRLEKRNCFKEQKYCAHTCASENPFFLMLFVASSILFSYSPVPLLTTNKKVSLKFQVNDNKNIPVLKKITVKRVSVHLKQNYVFAYFDGRFRCT